MSQVTVVGGGPAGCEAAWQLAEAGVRVRLVDGKPAALSPAHQTPLLCELVCSNSLRSDDPTAPAGLLKRELRRCGSLMIDAADHHRVPAGAALAVERFGFAREVTTRLALHPNVTIERRAIDRIPEGVVILATGPLTGGGLAGELSALCGGERLYFYDAIAPIVAADTIDMEHAFRASRWGKDGRPEGDACGEGGDVGIGDYVNCPVDQALYLRLVEEIAAARKVVPREFEEARYFEGCMPIEVMVERGVDVLRHGPMRPVGLTDPRTGRWPYAVVQLRPENRYLTAYNLVGFQTRLAYPEQQRILSMIPALREAEFLRFGSVHRNTYLDAPRLLGPELELHARPEVRVAGLLTGVEGYIESCAMGLLAAWFTAARLRGEVLAPPPVTTALGGLHHHIARPRGPGEHFAPTNINFGLLPRVEGRAKKRDRGALVAERAARDLDAWLAQMRQTPYEVGVQGVVSAGLRP
ncbi:MAG TPA: methylenetetrahydrofolate--tRNA-(uracil(54)-C(5))-methyltransferase (FADH(2)-oxidizing) TrmFO [Kofleriaceae bacterium]|nr:methylenetetrahydrofolate--tRNA-(uracil(54)-C(5))-methyltransferase (FADH(2)-oxidizing) TrmFO [Kofleriaceae bacterium]